MAYVEKYYTIWKDSEAKEHEIKLLQDGAGAGSTALEIQNLTPYEYFFRGDKKSQIKDQIFGREILFKFLVTSAEIDDIQAIVDSDYKNWKIEHYLDSTLDGVFWLQSDNFSKNYIKNGDYYEIQLSGVDGLGNVKNVEFKDFSDDSQYEDRVSLIETIKRALEHIGFELNFRVQLGTWCTNDSLMTSSECSLDKADDDNRRFATEKDGRLTNTSCYEVISELLEPLNCYLIQSEGFYWIINTREDDSYYFPIAWSNLAVSARVSSDLKVVIDAYDFTTLGDSQTIRPLETVGVTFRDRNVRDNSLTNGDFHLQNSDEWVAGVDLTNLLIRIYEPNYEMEALKNILIDGAPATIPNFYSIAQSIAVRGESDQIQVQFKIRCGTLTMDAGYSGPSYDERVEVTCQIRKGSSSGDIISSGASVITLGESDSSYRQYIYYFDIVEDDDYFIEFLIDKIVGNAWLDYDIIDIRFDDFVIVAAYSTGEDITFDSYKKISNADSVFIDSLDIDLKFGDSSSDTDIGAFKIDGTRTETWSRAGKTDNESINKLCGKNIIENFAKYKEYLHLSIFDETDSIFPHSIIQIGSKNFQQVNQYVSYPVKKQKVVDVELVEILNDSVNITVEDFGLSSVDGNMDSSSPPAGSVSNPSTNPSQPGLVGNLQQVTDVGNLTTNNIGITSTDDSYFTGAGGLAIGKTTVGSGLILDVVGDVLVTGVLNATGGLQEGGVNLSAIYAPIGHSHTAHTLQQVTDQGAITTNPITINGASELYSLRMDGDGAGMITLAIDGADDGAIAFDTNREDDRWYSKDVGSNFIIHKLADKLQFNYSSGNIIDDFFSWTTGMTMDTSGDIIVNGVLNATTNLQEGGTDLSAIYAPIGGTSQWTTTGSDIYYNTGNVGIGTVSPTSLLSLGDTTSVISTDTSDGTDNKRIALAGGGGVTVNQGAYIIVHGNEYASDGGALILNSGNATGNYISFGIGGSSAIRIDSDKNVGIGTTTPGHLLHVYKNIDFTRLARFEGAGSDYVDIFDYGIIINNASASIRNTLANGDITIQTHNGTSQQNRIFIDGDANAINFYNHDGTLMYDMNTNAGDPFFRFRDSAGSPSTTLYEDPTNLGGSFGSLVIDGGITGGYEGFSIGGRVVFMHDNVNNTGIYDNVNDQWMFFGLLGSYTEMRYAGDIKIQTSNTGATVTGILNASNYLQEAGVAISTIYSPIITGGATTIVSSNLTINRALISNGSGKVAVSATTSTELGYVSGVTSAIQTQLGGKEPTISPKRTAFNKNFGGSGALTTVSRSDHTHDDIEIIIVDIGDWNMDSTTAVLVAHGLANHELIRGIDVIIRNDDDSAVYTFMGYPGTNGITYIDDTNVSLSRELSGIFDGTGFDATSYNRGWITIWYDIS